MKSPSCKLTRPLALAITLLASHASIAQVLEEVIVTAQKKAESLQDTPIAISVFSSDSLEQRQAFGVADIGEYTPNVTMTPSLGSSYNIRMDIRGLGTAEPSLAVDPKVGMYLDGVYIARNAGAVFDVVDLERIEVLRGPQGTLWGKNTTGGAVNMVTAKPSGEWGFKQLLSAGNDGYYRSTTTINTQQVGGFSAKANLMFKGTDGWQDNTAATGKQDLGSEETTAAHIALAWDITDSFSADYTFDYTDGDSTPQSIQVGSVDPTSAAFTTTTVSDVGFAPSTIPGAPVPGLYQGNPYNQMATLANDKDRKDKFNLAHQGSEQVEIYGHALTLSWVIDNLELKSITAYRNYDSDFSDGNHIDGGTYYGSDDGGATQTWLPAFYTVGDKEQDQTSQEFQAIGSALDDRLNYVLGLYYFEEDGSEVNPWLFTNGTSGFLISFLGSYYKIESESKAVYGQFTYDLTDRLSATLGGRYSEDDKKLTLTANDPVLAEDDSRNENWSENTFSFVLDYAVTDDMNIYGKIAEGYASGLFNPGTVDRNPGSPDPTGPALTPVDPEETTSYELGIKSMWLDQRLQFNGAVFYNDNDNLQITDFVNGQRISINSGSSDAKGVELEVVALLMEGLTLDASYGYLNMDFDDSSRSQGSPKNTGTAGIQYEMPLDFGLLTSRLDMTYTDESYFSATDRSVKADDRTLLNARLTLSEVPLANGEMKFALWGRNLTDEEYIIHGANFGFYNGYTWGQPLSYGIDAVYEF
jgi:iron complex outermembrane receptor protein